MNRKTFEALQGLVAKYERRVDTNKRAHRVEVNIPLDDLSALLVLAKTTVGFLKVKE